MSTTPTSSAGRTLTPAMLPNDRAQARWSAASTTSTRSVALEPRQRRGAALVDGDSHASRVDARDRTALGVHRQRRTQRPPPRLAVDLDAVGPRPRAECHAAAGAMRHRERARAGAAGALLAPSLGPGHRHLPARLGRRRAAPAGGQLGAHRLVHQRAVEGLAEDRPRRAPACPSCRRCRALAGRASAVVPDLDHVPWARARSRAPAAGSRRRGRPRPRGRAGSRACCPSDRGRGCP